MSLTLPPIQPHEQKQMEIRHATRFDAEGFGKAVGDTFKCLIVTGIVSTIFFTAIAASAGGSVAGMALLATASLFVGTACLWKCCRPRLPRDDGPGHWGRHASYIPSNNSPIPNSQGQNQGNRVPVGRGTVPVPPAPIPNRGGGRVTPGRDAHPYSQTQQIPSPVSSFPVQGRGRGHAPPVQAPGRVYQPAPYVPTRQPTPSAPPMAPLPHRQPAPQRAFPPVAAPGGNHVAPGKQTVPPSGGRVVPGSSNRK